MINRIIDFSVNNKFIVFALAAAACVAGWWSMKHVAARRHPGPQRHAGDHLLALGPEPGHHRGPGDLSHRDGHAGRPARSRRSAASPISATPTSTSSSRTAPTSTGPGRAPRNISPPCCRACPEGVKTELGPDATGLGWIFQYALVDESGKHSLAELRSYQDWYLTLLPEVGARGRRGGAHRRLRQAVPGERRPEPAAGLRHLHQPGGGGGARRQQRDRQAG